MRFKLLGPMRVVTGDGAERAVPGTLRRTMLAMLLLHHDTPVSADRLADALWGGQPPASPTTPLYNQATRLRQALGEDGSRIRSASPGYQIDTKPGELDLESFTELCSEGRGAAEAERWAEATAAYTAALELWRGEPLADIPALHGHAVVQRVHEERLQALQGRAEAELRLGRHETVVGELRILVKENPLREEFHSQLMLALYRSGRQAEALEAYRTLRRVMIDELGVEPGPAVKGLHQRILRSDPALAPPPPPARPPAEPLLASAAASIRQLPADTRIFAGRTAELDELLALASGQAEPGTVVISAINGMGGVGKTALAVRAAHRLGDRFPDGQLFIDLHGYSADLDPVAPADALEYLLRSLGLPSSRIPASLDERVALYRSRLAGTRTLIVLDNAVNAAQARPLLPAASGCLVLVTSRNRLSSLDDAHMLALDVLPAADAVALLRDVAGPGRVPEDDPAAELVELCGRIPLAVRIAGSRLRHRSTLTTAALIAELRGERGRLDRISDGERDLFGVVGGTLKVLPHDVQRLFRLLGLVPGPDFDAYAAAHLAATTLDAARKTLETLLDHNLLIQHVPGRYRLHDLLRVRAVTLAEHDPDSPAALARLLDFYIHAARAADALITVSRRPETGAHLEIPEPTITFTDRQNANAWLRTERPNLLAAIADSAADPARRASIIGAMATHLDAEGPYGLAARLHESVVVYARERGDRLLEANALLEAASIMDHMGTFGRATDLTNGAVAIYRALGSKQGEANALAQLGHVLFVRATHSAAAVMYEQALEIYREINDRRALGVTLSYLGLLAHIANRNIESRTYYEEAIAIAQEMNDVISEANCLLIVGRVNFALDEYGTTIPAVERALQLFQKAGRQIGESNALQELGRQRLLRGEYEEASSLLDAALKIQVTIGFRLGEGNVYWEQGRIAFARGDQDAAMRQYQRALDIFDVLGTQLNRALALHEIARIHHRRGNFAAARSMLTVTGELYRTLDFPLGELEVRNSLAALDVDTVGDEAALAAYVECYEMMTTQCTEHPLERAHALEGMGRCELRLGRREAGVGHLRAAVELYRRMHAREYGAAAALLAEAEDGGEGGGAGAAAGSAP